jgi:tetratricopeptide (TPR) repeat protein
VTARTSSFYFRGKEADIREIGSRLNVENILEGSVRRAGSRIRVTAQLINVADGYHLWSERYDREMSDIFAIQDEISQAITAKLRIRLAGAGPLARRQTENLEAYDLCLKARHFLYKAMRDCTEKGRQYCEQAIALDPTYAPAHFRLAHYHWMCAALGHYSPILALPMAKSAVLEALALDDTLAEAHMLLGILLGFADFDWIGAEREYGRALELNPASPEVHYLAYLLLYATGRLDEAITGIRRALELDPLSPLCNNRLGALYIGTGEYDRAIDRLRFAIELDPNYVFAHWHLALTYHYKGLHDDAISIVIKAIAKFGLHPYLMMCLCSCYISVGRITEARRILEELIERSRAAHVSPFVIGVIHLTLGQLDEGFDQMMRSIEERDPLAILYLKADPLCNPFRSQPRFSAVLRKINLRP